MSPTKKTKLNVVGPFVKRVRLSKNPPMTQDQLAIHLQTLSWDSDRFGVSKIERGERQVTGKELLMMAKAMDVPVSQILEE